MVSLCIESSVRILVTFEGAGVMRRFLWCTQEDDERRVMDFDSNLSPVEPKSK